MNVRQAIVAAIIAAAIPTYLNAQQSFMASPGPTSGSQPGEQMTPGVRAIQDAADPSALIDAYAKAPAADHDNLAFQEMYLQKMIGFGLPEMAELQAQQITMSKPANGQAWAVLAYMEAKKDRLPSALSMIVTAYRRSPDDEFVLRTAGELVGLLDCVADKSSIPVATEMAVNSIRPLLALRGAYQAAYARVMDDYDRAKQEEAKQKAASEAAAQSDDVAVAGRGYSYSDVQPVFSDLSAYAFYPTLAYPGLYAYPSNFWGASVSLGYWYGDLLRYRSIGGGNRGGLGNRSAFWWNPAGSVIAPSRTLSAPGGLIFGQGATGTAFFTPSIVPLLPGTPGLTAYTGTLPGTSPLIYGSRSPLTNVGRPGLRGSRAGPVIQPPPPGGVRGGGRGR